MTDPIAAARELIEPLTGYASEPWEASIYDDVGYILFPLIGYDGDFEPDDARLIVAAPDLRDMVATLADALEAERAENQRLRASLQECLEIVDRVSDKRAYRALKTRARAILNSTEGSESMEAALTKAACRIRALTPSDAQAALDKLLSEARAEGWRAGREAAARYCVQYGQGLVEGEWGPEGLAVMLGARIRALPEPKGASHDAILALLNDGGRDE